MKKTLAGLLALVLLAGCASQMSRGSSKSLYTVSEVLDVHREDIGKSVQLKLDQKIFFKMDPNPDKPGQWSLVDYSNRVLLLLSETPRVESGNWGLLLQARAMGSGEVTLRFTPFDENAQPETATFEISITK